MLFFCLTDQTSCHDRYYLRALPFNYYYVKLIVLRWTKIEKWNLSWTEWGKNSNNKNYSLLQQKTFQFPLEIFPSKNLSSIALCFHGIVVVLINFSFSPGIKRIIIFARNQWSFMVKYWKGSEQISLIKSPGWWKNFFKKYIALCTHQRLEKLRNSFTKLNFLSSCWMSEALI